MLYKRDTFSPLHRGLSGVTLMMVQVQAGCLYCGGTRDDGSLSFCGRCRQGTYCSTWCSIMDHSRHRTQCRVLARVLAIRRGSPPPTPRPDRWGVCGEKSLQPLTHKVPSPAPPGSCWVLPGPPGSSWGKNIGKTNFPFRNPQNACK